MGRVPPGIKHMNSNLKTTKETLAILRCSNSTFQSHLEKQAIKPIRAGTRSFFTLEQIESLKNSIANEPTQEAPDESGEVIEQHSRELTEAREEIQMLSMQVSQWQRQAQIYQDLYQELLNDQQPQEEKKPEKSPGEKVSEKKWWGIFSER